MQSRTNLYTNILGATFFNTWKQGLDRRDHSIAKGHSKLELYSRVRMVFDLKRKGDLIEDSKTRNAVAKMRISAHHFPIERGHYKNIESLYNM